MLVRYNSNHMELSECCICTEKYFDKEFVTLLCNHKFCKTCISKYWNDQLIQGSTKLQCIYNCELFVDTELYVDILLPKNLQLMNHNIKKLRSIKSKVVVCEKCSSETKIGNDNTSVECNSCKSIICSECGYLEHEYIDCDQYILSQNRINKELTENISKCCPKCHFIITKNKGCDNMVCKRCQHKFKWSDIQNTSNYNKNKLTMASNIIKLTKSRTFISASRTTCYQIINNDSLHSILINIIILYIKRTYSIKDYPSYLLNITADNQKKIVKKIVDHVESIILEYPEKFSDYINYNNLIPI